MADMMGALAAGGALALGAMFARGHGRATHAVAGPAPQPAMARQAKAEEAAEESWDEGKFVSMYEGAPMPSGHKNARKIPQMPAPDRDVPSTFSSTTGQQVLIAGGNGNFLEGNMPVVKTSYFGQTEVQAEAFEAYEQSLRK